ncbi:Cj0069 family protein [Phenylobacterium sp.]|uniref:Cj0069 family protein n=1 Tax=Phenylobacterium sp. TaxID=1871053 RepID=UPI002ED8EA85
MGERSFRVAVVWRGDAQARAAVDPATIRLAPIFRALADAGLLAEPCVYDESFVEDVREQLLACDAALVWVNPLAAGARRDALDALLEEVEAAGVLVSARPSTIAAMGVKSVLYRTRDLGWGSDVRLYESIEAFATAFPASLAEAGPRVLKQDRGNDGQGVWKVERVGDLVEVREAHADGAPRRLPTADFLVERMPDLATGPLVDQAYQPRLPEGMIRAYMAGGRVAGFGHHLVRALAPPDAGPGGPRLYSGPDDPRFQRLRHLMESEWTPGLLHTLRLAPDDLPAVWDADFLLGPKDAAGQDSYVLCEINVSSVFPLPDEAPAALAAVLRERLQRRRADFLRPREV